MCVCVLVVAVMMLSEVMHGHLVGHVMLVWAEVCTLRIGSRLILVLETGLLGWETGGTPDESELSKEDSSEAHEEQDLFPCLSCQEKRPSKARLFCHFLD